MLIKNLTLKNIRSFENLNLDFNQGITLLSGDIGSGKTTILLAIEFALFGLLKGKISPSEILRHGEKEGHIKLHLTINNHDVIITRFLKRTNQTITQSQGTILIDGEENQLVATELKSKVLELLGYPQNLINKSSNLFRYTVFTPQEEVKLILFETIDERKDIIRKLFSLDKYKNISSNIAYYQTNLRETIQKNLGKIEDLENLKNQKNAKQKELDFLKEDIKNKSEEFILANTTRLDFQKNLSLIELEQEEIKKEKQKIELSKRNLANIQNTVNLLQKQKKDLEIKISNIKITSIEYVAETKQKINEKLLQLREQKSRLLKKEGELFAQKKQNERITSSVISLDNCPTCKQQVSIEYKEKIKEEQQDLFLKLQKTELLTKEALKKIEEQLSLLNLKFEETNKLEKEFLLQKQNINLKKSFEEQILPLSKQIDEYIKKQNDEQIILNELTKKEIKEINLEKEKNYLEELQKKEKTIELDLKSKHTRLEMSQQLYLDVQKLIQEKENIKVQTTDLISLKNWINDLFLPLLSTIEKKLMSKIYKEFNQLFINWFQTLMDDDSIYVKLDENFTPMLEQNGFDTNIENLSGGEKTSTALAYRLALNKVLNQYFSTVNTKELLILDEPTDGFSTEQLDKLSIVLKEFSAKQIIVVSHEQKLESLAENLIRVEKNQNSSKIYV
jgi:DNA repair protein SbcC/Rad50